MLWKDKSFLSKNFENYSQVFKHITWIRCYQLLGLMYPLDIDIMCSFPIKIAIKVYLDLISIRFSKFSEKTWHHTPV